MDTGAWYAVQVPDDRHHAAASAAWRELLERKALLLTSNLVVGETYTLLRATRSFEAAWRFAERIRSGGLIRTIDLDATLEAEAYALLRQFSDHAFSFVDATSFAICQRERIERAFAFDRHFAAAGVLRIPVDVSPRDL